MASMLMWLNCLIVNNERERERVRPLKAFSVTYGSDLEIDDRIRENWNALLHNAKQIRKV